MNDQEREEEVQPPLAAVMGRCARCKNDADPLRQCVFWYGKVVDVNTSGGGPVLEITTKYSLEEPLSETICSNCILKRRLMYIAGGLVSVALVWITCAALSAGFLKAVVVFPLMIAGAVLLLFGVFLDSDQIGDTLAISVHRKRLKKAGYRTFFTRAQHPSEKKNSSHGDIKPVHPYDGETECPRGHGTLKEWSGSLRCYTCGWPFK